MHALWYTFSMNTQEPANLVDEHIIAEESNSNTTEVAARSHNPFVYLVVFVPIIFLIIFVTLMFLKQDTPLEQLQNEGVVEPELITTTLLGAITVEHRKDINVFEPGDGTTSEENFNEEDFIRDIYVDTRLFINEPLEEYLNLSTISEETVFAAPKYFVNKNGTQIVMLEQSEKNQNPWGYYQVLFTQKEGAKYDYIFGFQITCFDLSNLPEEFLEEYLRMDYNEDVVSKTWSCEEAREIAYQIADSVHIIDQSKLDTFVKKRLADHQREIEEQLQSFEEVSAKIKAAEEDRQQSEAGEKMATYSNGVFSVRYPDVFAYVRDENYVPFGVSFSNTMSDSEWSVAATQKANESMQQVIDRVWQQFPDRQVTTQNIQVNDMDAVLVTGAVSSRPTLIQKLVLIDGGQVGYSDIFFVISNGASTRAGFEDFFQSFTVRTR